MKETETANVTDSLSVNSGPAMPEPASKAIDKRVGTLSIQRIFQDRMKREGRIGEFYANLKMVQESTGKMHGPALWDTMRRMGYVSADAERKMHDEFMGRGLVTQSAAEQAAAATEREYAAKSEFDIVFDSLPDKCSTEGELDWIRSHPAMLLKTRGNPNQQIVLSVKDLRPRHGPPPAKSAVIALQNWANDPAGFFKILLGEQKKKTDGGAGGSQAEPGSVVDAELPEIEQMLKGMGNGG